MTATMRPFVVALGSNLGDRAETLGRAVAALGAHQGVRVGAASSLWRSTALTLEGFDPDKPEYLNAVVTGSTELEPLALLDALQGIERSLGRVRLVRWGDRTIDLDLIDYDGRQSESPRLTLPHPRAHERDFVLAPWLEIAPEARLVGRGPIAGLLARIEQAGPLSCHRAGPLPEGAVER